MSEEHLPDNGLRLKALLKEAALSSTRLDASKRLVMFTGRTRDWSIYLNLSNGWLHIFTYVCEIPQATSLRAELFEAAMSVNHTISLAKFVKGEGLMLEVEYREEHIDPDVVSNLLSLVHSTAEEYYPRLFRIVSGDAVLETLSDGGTLAQLTR